MEDSTFDKENPANPDMTFTTIPYINAESVLINNPQPIEEIKQQSKPKDEPKNNINNEKGSIPGKILFHDILNYAVAQENPRDIAFNLDMEYSRRKNKVRTY